MRKNQYFRFYPIKGRRIKKIRGYVRMKEKSEISMANSCCDDDNLIFESAYDNGPDSIVYYHIIELISLHLNSLRISHSLSYDAIERILTIHFKNESIKAQLDNIITTILNLKSERKSLIDYIRRTHYDLQSK